MAKQLKNGEKLLRPVHPNAGIEAQYRIRLRKLVEAMHRSIIHWVSASYKANAPEIAQDALPSIELRRAIRKLVRQWQRRFNLGAPRLAKWFAQSASRRSDIQLARILREAGFSVGFKLTRAQRDIINATVAQNVGLIKSIPQRYLEQVEGIVMRSVQRGGDLKQLTRDLQVQFRVTRRRAVFIARDQNIKAVSALNRARQIELKIESAIWMHSHAGKVPRRTHVANDGKRYDVVKGWYDPDEGRYIQPGELINCRCTSKSIIKGFS